MKKISILSAAIVVLACTAAAASPKAAKLAPSSTVLPVPSPVQSSFQLQFSVNGLRGNCTTSNGITSGTVQVFPCLKQGALLVCQQQYPPQTATLGACATALGVTQLPAGVQ